MNRPLALTPPDRGSGGLPMIGLIGLLALTSWLVAGGIGALLATLAVLAALIWLPPLPSFRVMRWMRGKPIHPSDAPDLHLASQMLARRAGMPAAPRLYWLPHGMPNALAVGSAADPVVGLSLGALRTLSPRELRAVLAHEMAHLAAGDLLLIRLATVIAHTVRAAAVTGLVLIAASILAGAATPSVLGTVLLLVAAPFAAAMLLSAVSRDREFAADRRAADLTGDPLGLASALSRIERQHRRRLPSILRERDGVFALLRSHPATADRVDRLLALRPPAPMAGSIGLAPRAPAGQWSIRLAVQ